MLFLNFLLVLEKYCLFIITFHRLKKRKSSQDLHVIMNYKHIIIINKMEKEVSYFAVDWSKVLFSFLFLFLVLFMNCSKGELMNSNKPWLCLISTYDISNPNSFNCDWMILQTLFAQMPK